MRRRKKYMIQPANSGKWIQCHASALQALQSFHGQDRVTVEVIEPNPCLTVHFISISHK